jgi:hypothetical protein
LIAPRDGRANSHEVAILQRGLTHELELFIDAVRRGYRRWGVTIKSTEFPESDSVESDECEAARRQRKIVADELIVAYELRHPKTPNEHAPTFSLPFSLDAILSETASKQLVS